MVLSINEPPTEMRNPKMKCNTACSYRTQSGTHECLLHSFFYFELITIPITFYGEMQVGSFIIPVSPCLKVDDFLMGFERIEGWVDGSQEILSLKGL